jgi:hypothetical protein
MLKYYFKTLDLKKFEIHFILEIYSLSTFNLNIHKYIFYTY